MAGIFRRHQRGLSATGGSWLQAHHRRTIPDQDHGRYGRVHPHCRHVPRFNFKLLIRLIHFTDSCTGGYYKGKVRYLSVIAASWCFVAFVFVNVYNSTLTSTLAISYKAPEINSVQQLADSTKFQLVTIKGILPDMQIMVPFIAL